MISKLLLLYLHETKSQNSGQVQVGSGTGMHLMLPFEYLIAVASVIHATLDSCGVYQQLTSILLPAAARGQKRDMSGAFGVADDGIIEA